MGGCTAAVQISTGLFYALIAFWLVFTLLLGAIIVLQQRLLRKRPPALEETPSTVLTTATARTPRTPE